ncbi:MAG: helix-turn-helix domain-containing protein, partial [Planctomycetales bacterium]
MADNYLNLADAASRLNVSEDELRRLCEQGVISPTGDGAQFEADALDPIAQRIRVEGVDTVLGENVLEEPLATGESGTVIGADQPQDAEIQLETHDSSGAGVLSDDVTETIDLDNVVPLGEDFDDDVAGAQTMLGDPDALSLHSIDQEHEDREMSVNFDDLDIQPTSELEGLD